MDGEASLDSDWPIKSTWNAYMDNYFVDLMVTSAPCISTCSSGYSEFVDNGTRQVIPGSCNADRATRTSWKPHMDRYFISLMLDQVNKGNRCGNGCPGFTKDAWIQMASLMREKFPIECDKNSLKKRVRILKKKYTMVKTILEHEGFSWDEAREMVIADDYLWDEYIKVHSDARSYRAKPVPYNDLSIIFSRDIIVDGKYSRSGYATCHTSCFYLPEVKETENEVPNVIDRGRKTSWTPPMDQFFVELLLEQVHRGSWCDTTYAGFPKAGWRNLAAQMRKKFSIEFAKSTLQNRVKTYRKHYDTVKALLRQDDFHWDESRQMVTAEDDVWDEYTKVHNDAKIYRFKSVPHYDDFCIIFSRDDAKEKQDFLDHLEIEADLSRLDNGTVVSQDAIALSDVLFEEASKPLNIGGNSIIPNLHDTHQYDQPFPVMPQKKSKKTTDECMADAMTAIATAVAKIIDNSQVCKKSASMERCIEALHVIPNLDKGMFLDACDFLEDKKRIELFLAFDAEERRMWLLKQLHR